jgi:adenylyl-sulfate kinase
MNKSGFTVWFTGLPSSGKTTLARMLEPVIRERGYHVEVLDGDEVRLHLSKGLGFSKEDRDENIRRIGYVAGLITRSGGVAVTCAISPYRAIRDEARQKIGQFVEVYVKCSLDECISRDVKGLYKRALQGEIKNFTGVSDPYEEPMSPEVVVETDRETPEASLRRIVGHLEGLGHLQPERFTGLTPVLVPAYLYREMERRATGSRFPDVSHYVTHLLTEALSDHGHEPIPVEEKEGILERLRDLGYVE